MSTVPMPRRVVGNGYPTGDGKPMAETDYHRDLMLELIETLKAFYADEALAYVSGNLLLFYEEGDRRKHVSPDVFVVRGVNKEQRPNYLLWEEGHAPRFVIELTSSSTRRNDTGKKFELYRDVLKVREYFLFDPLGDYLRPSMQGWRLVKGVYKAIRPVDGRLPSQTTGLHLERDGRRLRLWNPETRRWLLTPAQQAEVQRERAEVERERAEAERERAEAEREQAEQERGQAEQRRDRAEAENARLRRLLERAGISPDAGG
jgi:Uma2 family endonuclease